MAKYGSAAWLKDFIRHPDAARHYGEKNRMPAYSPEQLSDSDLELLVRWMTKDYTPTIVDDYPNQLAAFSATSGDPEAPDAAAASAAVEQMPKKTDPPADEKAAGAEAAK
jgi:hypothetical protein